MKEFNMNQCMTKQSYLQDVQVSQFIQKMAKKIDKPQTYRYYHDKNKRDWECSSNFNADEKYEWKGKNFRATKADLDKWSGALNNSLRTNSDTGCKTACESILKWGGVQRGNKAKLEKIQEKGIVRYLTKVKEQLTSEKPDLSGVVMSSGFSKIY